MASTTAAWRCRASSPGRPAARSIPAGTFATSAETFAVPTTPSCALWASTCPATVLAVRRPRAHFLSSELERPRDFDMKISRIIPLGAVLLVGSSCTSPDPSADVDDPAAGESGSAGSSATGGAGTVDGRGGAPGGAGVSGNGAGAGGMGAGAGGMGTGAGGKGAGGANNAGSGGSGGGSTPIATCGGLLADPAPSSKWVSATGNLANMPSDCGTLGRVLAKPCSKTVIASVTGHGLWAT